MWGEACADYFPQSILLMRQIDIVIENVFHNFLHLCLRFFLHQLYSSN